MRPRPLIGSGLGSSGGSAAFGGEDGASAAAALVGASRSGLSYLGGGRMNPRPLAGLGFGPPTGFETSVRGDAPSPPVALPEVSGPRLPVLGCAGVSPCLRTGFAFGRLRFTMPESLLPNRAHKSKIGIRATLAQRQTLKMMSTASILYSPLRPLFRLPVPFPPNLSRRLPARPMPKFPRQALKVHCPPMLFWSRSAPETSATISLLHNCRAPATWRREERGS